jgi:hypothetical protein
MRVAECSMCRRPSAWLIDTEVFCEGHKELIIGAAGADRFRDSSADGSRFCLPERRPDFTKVAIKKETQNPHGEIA